MFSGRTKGCFESPPYLDQVAKKASVLSMLVGLNGKSIFQNSCFSSHILIFDIPP